MSTKTLLPMIAAPKDGTRIGLIAREGKEYHGWFEENLGWWMSMDKDWNLICLEPTNWFLID
jgi:hypothetical protein